MEVRAKTIEMVNINSLVPHPKNMNRHSEEQIERLCKIIDYQGFRNPLIVQKGTNLIVAGHGRLLAAKKLNMKEVPVTYQEFESEEQLYACIVSDNAIASWADLDLGMINAEIENLGPDLDIDLLGIKDFVVEPVEKYDEETEDDVPEVKHEPVTKKGDVWLLGKHRVMCGDSTMIDDVEKLMNGEKADMVFTDPPYGMNAVSKSGVLSKNYKTDIKGDDSTDAAKDSFRLLYEYFNNAKHIWWGSNYYSECLPDSECWIVWDKNNGQSDQTDCELAWTNFRSVVRQFTQSSEKKNRIHPTQKPVSLFEWTVEKFKQNPNLVFDAFLGSGSTLIACEKTNRKCYGMELDEHYCDVIVERWQKYTGKLAILEGSTDSYDNMKQKRL